MATWASVAGNSPGVGGRLGGPSIAALIVAEFFITLDGSALTVALPTIRDTLDADAAALQWTQIAYMIAAAAFALPFGAIGDRLGRHRVLGVALALFLLGSAMTGTAQSMLMLILGRAIAGAGASGILVLALAILTAGVPKARVAAVVGAWTALSSAASVVAPAFSGLVVGSIGWRWLFLMSAIPALLVLVVVLRGTSSDQMGDTPVDWRGSALLTIATVLLVSGINSLSTGTVSGLLLVITLALGGLALIVFVVQQGDPGRRITDWTAMSRRPIPVLLGLRWALSLVFVGVAYQQTMLLQNGLGFSPLAAGLLDAPPALAAAGAAAMSAPLAKHLGIGPSVCMGFLSMSMGIFGLAMGDRDYSLPVLVGSFVLIGAGFGLNTAALSAGVFAELPEESQGGGSGLLNLVNQLASVLGIAIVGAGVSFWITQSWLSLGAASCERNPDMVADVIAGSLSEIGSTCGTTMKHTATEAYFDGITDALLVASILLAVTAVAAVILLRPRRTAVVDHATATVRGPTD